jgi:cell wall-associated NlpC family hydrolase
MISWSRVGGVLEHAVTSNAPEDAAGGSVRLSLSNTFRSTLTAAIATVLILSTPGPASATPSTPEIEAKQEEAAAAEAKLDELQAQLELRSEEYLAIDEELQQTRADLEASKQELTEADAALGTANDILEKRAAGIYRNGGVGMLEVLLDTNSFEDFITRMDFLRRLNVSDATLVVTVKDARERVSQAKETVERREAELVNLRDRAEVKRLEVEKALSAQKSFVDGLNSEVAQLIEQERKRQEELAAERARQAAAAAALAASNSSSSGAGRSYDGGALGAGHPEAVQVGLKYVGVPYVWGGTTPTGFDCSGLTQYVYREIGILIPRTSRSQFQAGAHVPPGQLNLLVPGDLVFFGYNGDPGRVHHVGIYVGGGDYLHAPSAGQKVRVDSLTARISNKGDYVGASRF